VKKLLILCFATFVLSASELQWNSDFKVALQEAKHLNKPILVVVSKPGCGWCKRLEKRTLQNSDIDTLIQKNFVRVHVMRHRDYYPENLKVVLYPTTYFLDAQGKVIKKSIGYLPPADYKNEIDEALNLIKKNKGK